MQKRSKVMRLQMTDLLTCDRTFIPLEKAYANGK